VRDDTFGVGDEDDRMREAVTGRPFRESLIEDIERLDDVGLSVRKQRHPDFLVFRESRERPDIVITDEGDVVAAFREVRVPFVPGDRLKFAVGSPVERTGKKQNQAGSPHQRLQAVRITVLVRRAHRQRDRLADLESLIQIVSCLGRVYGHDQAAEKRRDHQQQPAGIAQGRRLGRIPHFHCPFLRQRYERFVSGALF